MSNQLATATLAGGCFWCLEAVFENLRGVQAVVSGYIGGQQDKPSYETVCTGKSGHAEAVQIRFDTAEIGYDDLLDVFFTIHDPTTLNRQGNDVGTQYRSAIFYHDEAQLDAARAKIAALQHDGLWSQPIVTQLERAVTFYPAEQYHQHYFENHPGQPYCQLVVAPKVAKARAKFAARLKR